MMVTPDTSHSPMGPCGPLGQSPFGDTCRHAVTARLSDDLYINVAAHIVPAEPVNMSILLAFDFTQGARQSCCLNDVACQNMWFILVTFDTSHFEMSPLKDFAPLNILDIVVTLDTSHFE